MTVKEKWLAVLVVCVLAAAATACSGDAEEGDAGPTSSVPVDQTIEVRMQDIKFQPETLTVQTGQTVRFVFRNTGDLDHEAAFGDEATQQAVEEGKQKRDGVLVSPKKTEDFIKRFDAPGVLIIGCHVAGHYAAGMRIRLTVA